MKKKIEKYNIRCCCLNCGYGNKSYEIIQHNIPLETLAGNYLLDKKCPYCGCLTLIRKTK
jgi:hypothetical protein